MRRNILVVVAHPDDEVLGCGATIARHADSGDCVRLIVMADGVTARSGVVSGAHALRAAALTKASEILGISQVTGFEFPDNQLDSIPLLTLVQKLEVEIAEFKPQIVYTHFHGDLNIDHQRTHSALMTACRPLPDSSVGEIYGFEVLSATEWSTPQPQPFSPNVFIDISKYLPKKRAALEAYAAEMRSVPHSRSIEHAEILARHRGYCVGLQAAEAFVAYRLIKRGHE
jgi:N-acetylglucosamine malate deacetylase 1